MISNTFEKSTKLIFQSGGRGKSVEATARRNVGISSQSSKINPFFHDIKVNIKTVTDEMIVDHRIIFSTRIFILQSKQRGRTKESPKTARSPKTPRGGQSRESTGRKTSRENVELPYHTLITVSL